MECVRMALARTIANRALPVCTRIDTLAERDVRQSESSLEY